MKATILVKGYQPMNFILDEGNAPLSVANFVSLANSGFYNGLIFHRVIPDFMIQGGGMTANMQEKGGLKPIKGEFLNNGVNNRLRHTTGVISMARTMVADSATSQFFICVTDTPHLDGAYAAFGYAADEQTKATAIEISKVQTGRYGYYSDVPLTPIVIESVTISD